MLLFKTTANRGSYLQDDGYLLLPWFGRLPLPVGV